MEIDLYSEPTRRRAAWAFFGLALAYAFVAGLRTVADFDVGWLLLARPLPRDPSRGAANRCPVLHGIRHALDLSSIRWRAAVSRLYSWRICRPVVDQRVGLHSRGSGYRRTSAAPHCALAILAVPSIAFRTAPRAELFTTFFFAAYLALLWQHRHEKRKHRQTVMKKEDRSAPVASSADDARLG